jgi:hypothetical protein
VRSRLGSCCSTVASTRRLRLQGASIAAFLYHSRELTHRRIYPFADSRSAATTTQENAYGGSRALARLREEGAPIAGSGLSYRNRPRFGSEPALPSRVRLVNDRAVYKGS